MSFKDTSLGSLPSNWNVDIMENALAKIIDYRGKTPKKADEGIETLSAKSVKNGYIDYEKAYFISEETYKSFMVRGFPKKGDILLTTEAPLGLVAKLDRDKVGIAQRLLTLRGKEGYLLNDYLRYYLMSSMGQHQLTSRETGTTVKGIKQKEFRKCLITIPPHSEQEKIAKILSTLDDKIKTNNQINKNLENMAQAIFTNWFVDFEFPNGDGEPYKSSGGEMVESELGMIPKGWEVVSIGDLANNIKDTVKGKDINSRTAYMGLEHIPRVKMSLDSWDIVEKIGSNKYRFNRKDILFGKLRPYFHKVGIAPIEGICSTDILVIRAVKEEYFCYLAQVLFSKAVVEFASAISTGTRMPRANWKGISGYQVVLPETRLLEDYSNIFMPIIEKFRTLIIENNELSDIRDTLLPKLMSGEIRVPLED